jgi:uncharacterized protein YdaU (DUF1376 family)
MTENHWYPHYLGDYIKDTSHLSLTEHGAYRVLLDHYYSTKQPLPAIADQLYRICRAFADNEKQAVDSVLKQFFKLKGDLYTNKRADSEISKRQAISKERSKAAKSKNKSSSANAKQLHSNSNAIATTATATTTAITTSAAQQGDFERVYSFGSELFPQLATQATTVITTWLDAGCSPELDIIPELKRLAGKSIKSWTYFTGGIMDAKATREKPPPKGTARFPGRYTEPKKSNVTTL